MPGYLTDDFCLYDPTDQTKQLNYDISALPTATLRTLTIPSGGFGSGNDTMALWGERNNFSAGCSFLSEVTIGDFSATIGYIRFEIPNGGASGNLLYVSDASANQYFTINSTGDMMATLCAFADVTNATRRMLFDCSGISNSTTRTLTVPNANIVIAGSASALTSGRIPFATTGGILTDDADLTFATDTLTVTKIAATTFTGDVAHDTKNISTDTGTGTKIGSGTTQKLGFWNASPVAQYATTGTTTGFTAGAGTTVDSAATFTGNTGSTAYTIGDVVRALKLCGIIAA